MYATYAAEHVSEAGSGRSSKNATNNLDKFDEIEEREGDERDENDEEVVAENRLRFDEHCTPHYREMVNYARRLASGDLNRAQDVVQDALIRAYRAWPRFVRAEGTQSLEHAVRGWLYKIVMHTYVSDYHAVRRRRAVELVGTYYRPLSREDQRFDDGPRLDEWDPGFRADHDPRSEHEEHAGDEVLEAVARLMPVHRQVIEMHYLQEMEIVDIAAFLGVSRKTVGTRLFRARVTLKKYLGEYAETMYGFDKDAPLRALGRRRKGAGLGRTDEAGLEDVDASDCCTYDLVVSL